LLEPIDAVPMPPSGGDFKSSFALSREFRDDVQIVGSNGSGELVDLYHVPVGGGPRDVVALDLNADGQLDLITADTGVSSFTLILQTNGGFDPMATVPLKTPPHHLAAADMDGDGGREVIASVGLDAQGGVSIWKSAAGALVPVGEVFPLSGAARITAGDLDADGDVDLAVVHSDGLALLRNDGGSLALAASLLPCDEPWAAAIADIDGSGTGDVVVACRGAAVLLFDPMLGNDNHLFLGPAGRLYDVLIADFDSNDTLDIAAADVLDHAVLVWSSPMAGGNAAPFHHPVHRGPVALGAVDFGWDGDIDVTVVAYEQRTFEVLENATKE
jgi:hypothetical protein